MIRCHINIIVRNKQIGNFHEQSNIGGKEILALQNFVKFSH